MSEMLDKMEEECIFKVETLQNGFLLTECCDTYFNVEVTKEELIQLGEELIQLANKH